MAKAGKVKTVAQILKKHPKLKALSAMNAIDIAYEIVLKLEEFEPHYEMPNPRQELK